MGADISVNYQPDLSQLRTPSAIVQPAKIAQEAGTYDHPANLPFPTFLGAVLPRVPDKAPAQTSSQHELLTNDVARQVLQNRTTYWLPNVHLNPYPALNDADTNMLAKFSYAEKTLTFLLTNQSASVFCEGLTVKLERTLEYNRKVVEVAAIIASELTANVKNQRLNKHIETDFTYYHAINECAAIILFPSGISPWNDLSTDQKLFIVRVGPANVLFHQKFYTQVFPTRSPKLHQYVTEFFSGSTNAAIDREHVKEFEEIVVQSEKDLITSLRIYATNSLPKGPVVVIFGVAHLIPTIFSQQLRVSVIVPEQFKEDTLSRWRNNLAAQRVVDEYESKIAALNYKMKSYGSLAAFCVTIAGILAATTTRWWQKIKSY